MSRFALKLRHTHFEFADLKTLLAKASPLRSGDQLAGIAAANMQERVAAQMILADVPLQTFLDEPLLAPEVDEVTRLILESHDAAAFAPIANFCVGQLRDWLLRYETTTETLSALAWGLTPEMVAAVSKIMGNQDLILVARKCRVVTSFRDTIGLPNRLSVRLQPNHPTDNPRGIAASILDGLLMGCGDAVIGINPASDSVAAIETLVHMMAEIIESYAIPTQSCVLAHVTTQIKAIERGVPIDLVFQSVAGTEAANKSFGINLRVLEEACDAARSLGRGTVGNNVMYFETGQGSCLSANAHFGIDQQTLEARAYAVARRFEPLLVNTVVGFIGPEYLYDGKQIIRAGLEDHFCGKMLGVPMGCDICYTNHAAADQDDMDNLLLLLGAAGCNFIMGIPGADDIMLGYQSTSFHDVHFLRQTLGLKPAPEFESWLENAGVSNAKGELQPLQKSLSSFAANGSKSLPLPTSSTRSSTQSAAGENVPSEIETQTELSTLLRAHTTARLALPRAGGSLGTPERLDFHMAHANARDAVHWPFNRENLIEQMQARSWPVLSLWSDAPDRAAYLQRPDWGRRLAPRSRAELEEWQTSQTSGFPTDVIETKASNANTFREDAFQASKSQRESLASDIINCDIVIVVTDGLSALAVERNALRVLDALVPMLRARNWKLGPMVVVANGRVALQDEIGDVLRARMSLILIGERPGLGTPDSLGAYLVFNPRESNTDANRNCVSNIRDEGLPPQLAAEKLLYLMTESFARGLSGVDLKDETPALEL